LVRDRNIVFDCWSGMAPRPLSRSGSAYAPRTLRVPGAPSPLA